MGNLALRVDGLGKMYRIGGKQERYSTLRDTITDAVAAPFKRARSLMRGEAYGAAGLKEEIWALKDVSFEVKHGEVVGIIGRNGAGKSTLLKILSRITEPTTGYAEVFGRVGALLEVGTGFHPELTGRENIYLNGAILGMSREEINRKFDEIVDFAEIERFIDTPVKHYSSGMGLRLGFAVAAHLEPEILVVDEVLAVGDAQFQKKCLGKMSEVAGEGRTVLFVSHNMGMVNILTATCCWLQNGQVELLGSTEQVISKYLDSTAQQSAIADHESAAVVIHTIALKQREELCSSGLIDFGLSFEIEIVLESKVDSEDVHFLFAIVSGDGNRFATMNSSDVNSGVNLNSGEKYIVRWKCIENCLVPGRYYLEFNVHDRFRAAIARYENIATLEITSLGAPVRLARNTLRAGYIALPSNWYIQAI